MTRARTNCDARKTVFECSMRLDEDGLGGGVDLGDTNGHLLSAITSPSLSTIATGVPTRTWAAADRMLM